MNAITSRTRLVLAASLANAVMFALASPLAFASDKDVDKVMGSITAHAGEAYGELSTVNGSIRVESGANARDVSTVNGGIHLEASAKVADVETVNGSIQIDDKAEAGAAETVNGSVRLGKLVRVAEIETVNGSVFTDRGSEVRKNVETVNGAIGLVDTDLGGSISTVNGDITVGFGSHVRGGITVEKPNSNWTPVNVSNKRKPRVIIAQNAVVDGPLVFKREVQLYVHSSAKIGQVTGATPVRYEGATAPKE
jgi:DUF4097 and DUF4098 domain-containing protein YvlB